jgi:hypothetical protein
MALVIEIVGHDVTLAAEWASFRYAESIGPPDEMAVDVIAFTSDPPYPDAAVATMFANPADYFYATARLGTDTLFHGLVRVIRMAKPARGAMRYALQASGWQFMMPRRLVGAPVGDAWYISEPGAEPVLEIAPAYANPTAAGVHDLFDHYWPWPPIDTTTFVTDILPGGGDQMSWSGSDLEGAIDDLAAAGSAAALWWFANDSPTSGLWGALHFGIVTIPDEGDLGDDLLAGFPSADPPTNLAPYNISDTPDWTTSILAVSLDFTADHSQRIDAVYVRGATGFQYGPPVQAGGTGWVGDRVGWWGAEYLDAPAATHEEQRDAFGNAVLASRATPAWTGTIVVSGYDGWHKGQAIAVTDADYGFVARWFLIRAVSMTQKDPFAEANEYTLTLGDVLSPSLGYALRSQRLAEARKPVDPGVAFVVFHGNLLLDPAGVDTSRVEGQFATAAGGALAVPGISAHWRLWVNGTEQADPFDVTAAWWLSDQTTVTDEVGKVQATLNVGAAALASDAVECSIDVVL